MLSFFLQPPILPFSVALALLFSFVLLEMLSLLIGSSFFSAIDDLLPDFDVDPGMSSDAWAGGDGALTWLMLGKAPFLVILSVFLALFAVSGLLLQQLVKALMGSMLPGWLAALPVFVVAVMAMRPVVAAVARWMPKEESSAVSQQSLAGKLGVIVQGTARKNHPAQARVHDAYGQRHYVLVEPASEEESFAQGEQIVVVEHLHGDVFIAMPFHEV